MKRTARTRLVEERKHRGWSQQELADHLGTTQHNVSRWEAGLTTPGPYFRAKLCELLSKSAQDLGLIEQAPRSSNASEETSEGPQHTNAHPTENLALWTVPYLRNPHFTGREELLERLDQQFWVSRSDELVPLRQAALTQPQAIKGLGGMGKTQIAVEYAYRAREQGRYTHFLWINAASEEAIMTSFATLAEAIPGVTATKEADQRKLVAAIIRWLERCQERWLLIFDNADDVALLQPYLPQQGNGSLLFTTREHAVGAFAASIDVERMGLVEGTMLLLHRAQRQHTTNDEQNEATNIVIALDGFPLALDQAGAYIEETGCSFADYLQTYQEHHQALLARRGRQATNYPDSVATTWSLSFEHIEQNSSAAAELLHLCVFLAPDAIPEELLTEGAAHWPAVLQQAVADRFAFDQMLEALLRFSLIKRRVEERTLSLHRLVQVVQRDKMGPEEQRAWAERVVCATNLAFPETVEMATWSCCLRLLPQAQMCSVLLQDDALICKEAASLFSRTANYLYDHALYQQAELLYQRALDIWETLNPIHPQMAEMLNGLANLYTRQGKYAQAEQLFQRVLYLWEQALGSEHLQVARVLNNLAQLYVERGKYAQAEPLFQRALRIYGQHVKPEDPLPAYCLNNLGILYEKQGKYAQAKQFYQQALHIREQALGTEHLLTAYPLINLANLYTRQGKYVQAERLYQRALHIREQALAPGHPDIAYPLNNLAYLYEKQGRYEQAEDLYRRVLSIREQALGAEHPKLAYPYNGLGFTLFKQGKHEQAEAFWLHSLSILEQASGSDYPEMINVLAGLANLYSEQGQDVQAEAFYLRALQMERHVGYEHPNLASPLNGLAKIYSKQGKNQQVESLYRRALSLHERTLGEQHLETAETLHNFAVWQEARGRHLEAGLLYQRTLSIQEKILGEAHPTTIATRTRLLELFHMMESTEEAAVTEKAFPEETSS